MEKRNRDEKMGGQGPQTRGSPGRQLPRPPPHHSRGPPPWPPRPYSEPIDRKKTCPLLLRVFTKIGAHHREVEFAVRGNEPKDEVQICTWKDAKLYVDRRLFGRGDPIGKMVVALALMFLRRRHFGWIEWEGARHMFCCG